MANDGMNVDGHFPEQQTYISCIRCRFLCEEGALLVVHFVYLFS